MRYEELQPISRNEFEQTLSSCEPEEIARGLLRMALHETDLLWAEQKCLSALNDASNVVKSAAVTALGHLARIHGNITREIVVPKLKHLKEDPILRGVAEDALDDIAMFAP